MSTAPARIASTNDGPLENSSQSMVRPFSRQARSSAPLARSSQRMPNFWNPIRTGAVSLSPDAEADAPRPTLSGPGVFADATSPARIRRARTMFRLMPSRRAVSN